MPEEKKDEVVAHEADVEDAADSCGIYIHHSQ
jgi:hypothetical protein